jgi:hypothetical protein
MTAAPATAATPMLARLDDAPEEDPDAVVVADAEGDEALEAADALDFEAELEADWLAADDEDDPTDAADELEATEEVSTLLVETTEAEVIDAADAALEAALPVVAIVADPEAEPEAEAVRQPDDPELMVNAAELATVPVESRRARPMEVPEAILVDQVYEVPVWEPRLSRAAAPGWFPG